MKTTAPTIKFFLAVCIALSFSGGTTSGNNHKKVEPTVQALIESNEHYRRQILLNLHTLLKRENPKDSSAYNVYKNIFR